ncbi:amidohydrolase family protein [Terrabacter aerolatus]|nr:amidohydrolase family protein [Terrabacter aerolatus]
MVADVDALVERMDELGVQTIVNLDGRSGDLDENLERYDRRHPGRFVTFTHLNYPLLLGEDHAAGLRMLRRAFDNGAGGVKVWKDLGLSVTDASRGRVAVDDRRLEPVWAAAADAGRPVLIHVAEPRAFFTRPDRHNERVEELRRHPRLQLHRSGTPDFGQLLDEFQRVLAGFRDTTFVAAHLANWGDDLAACARLLDEHPNLHLDTSARLAELGRQPRAAAAFLTRYADRVLFGTDAYPPSAAEMRVWFRALETADEYFPYTSGQPLQGRWQIYGLELDDDVLRSVYAENARRILGRP